MEDSKGGIDIKPAMAKKNKTQMKADIAKLEAILNQLKKTNNNTAKKKTSPVKKGMSIFKPNVTDSVTS